jgi:hypothetical protein
MRAGQLISLAVQIVVAACTIGCGGGNAPAASAPVELGGTTASGTQAAAQVELGQPMNLYVSPGGDDSSGDGSAANPYKTIGRALQDVPTAVSEHYIINLAPGTYREEVGIGRRHFGTTLIGNFNKSAVELKGDPAAPDNYVISGANEGNPTVPLRDNVVVCSFANCILNGVSLQFGAEFGFLQQGGLSVIHACTFRHFKNPDAVAVDVRLNALAELRGDSIIDDASTGLQIENYGAVIGYGSYEDPLNTGFPPNNTLSLTRISGQVGIAVYEHGFYDVSNTTSISGTGSTGLSVWDYSTSDSETTVISGFTTSVSGGVFGRIEINRATFSHATTGVSLSYQSRMDFLCQAPVFDNVTTQYALSGNSWVSTPSGTMFDGSMAGTGPVDISAGGSNQNVTLNPSGTGSVVLNGLVGIGAASTGPKLMISGAGGSQTYLNVNDTSPSQDTLVKLDAAGDSNDSFFLKAQAQGSDKWWVKGDGSSFSTSLSAGINIVPYSPTPYFDLSLGNTQKITLTGDVTTSSVLNGEPGEYLFFLICQDANGGHRFTWPANFRGGMNIGGRDILVNAVVENPSTCSAQPFIFDGTEAYALSPGVPNM